MIKYKWFFHFIMESRGGICDEKITELVALADDSSIWPFPICRR